MDINEILKKLDALFGQNKIEEIEPFLLQCLEEAKETENFGVYISICNELIGFYRSVSNFRKAFDVSEDVLLLMEELQLENTEHFATTLLNVATAYRAAGEGEKSYSYYMRAMNIYEQLLEPDDYRFASLYNNMSILSLEQGNDEKAAEELKKALTIIEKLDSESPERATTLTNLALIYFKQNKNEEARETLELALQIFDRNGKDTDAHYSAALAGIGEAYYHMEEYEKSLQSYEKSLEEIKKHFGENESYALVCSNCSSLCEKLQDKEKAEYYKEKSAKIMEKIKLP